MAGQFNRRKAGGFTILVCLVVGFGLSFLLVPPQFLTASAYRGVILAFLFGASVGASEIVSRYRDEPVKACRSAFGLIYILLNGMLGVYAFFIILRYPDKFGFPKDSPIPAFLGALIAGFGASAVMRTRLMVLKGSDNKDISIGPDLVIKTLLQMVDQYVDRGRAASRLEIVSNNLPKLRALASSFAKFGQMADYLLTSLLAFQNLDDDRKNELHKIFSDYDQEDLPPEIKYLAVGFVFLTVVGENQFQDVLDNAVKGLIPTAAIRAKPPN